MWDCGPYADLYEEFDDEWGEYEWFEDNMRQPMEFAKNNMKAFLNDLESAPGLPVHLWCEFGDTAPMGGRFKFELCARTFAGGFGSSVVPEVWKMRLWMPSDRLSQIRDMGKYVGPRSTLLVDGRSLAWEKALDKVHEEVRERSSQSK